jgi:hypothetical protein
MLCICTVELELRLERHTVGQTTLQTLLDRVAWLVDEVINKLQNEVVSGVCNWEILVEHLEQALILAILGCGVKLEKISERLKLNLQQVRIWNPVLDGRKAYSLLLCCGHIIQLFKLRAIPREEPRKIYTKCEPITDRYTSRYSSS